MKERGVPPPWPDWKMRREMRALWRGIGTTEIMEKRAYMAQNKSARDISPGAFVWAQLITIVN
jgi:hypothetical protein